MLSNVALYKTTVELQMATVSRSPFLGVCCTKESKVTGRNSRDWEKKKTKETKLKYFQLAQIVKTPLCGTTW